MDRQQLLKLFPHEEERLAFAKVYDLVKASQNEYKILFSDFLYASLVTKLVDVIQKNSGFDGCIAVFGDELACERKMLGFAPAYWEDVEFPVSAVKISFHKKFGKDLTHRDFLGSILGLGVDRGKIGDIFGQEDCAIVLVKDDWGRFLCGNLERIGRTSVVVEPVSMAEYDFFHKAKEESRITVSSLRLDAVIAEAFGISRSKASDLIDSEKAFVNHMTITNGTKPVKENDMISLRGFGKIQVLEVLGKTKKDKFLMSMYKY